MALQKQIVLKDGNSANYIRFVGIALPVVMRDSNAGIGSATVYFDVYRDEAAKVEQHEPSTQLQITFPGQALIGMNLSTTVDEIAKAIYGLKSLFPDLADAVDLIDE
jgi:hypothetical protein